MSFIDENGEAIAYQSGIWSFKIGDDDVSDIITLTTVEDGKIKI